MTYVEQVRLAGGVPILVETHVQNGFQPDLDMLRSAVTTRTKALVINTPCNPTGAVYSEETMRGIAELAHRHGLWVVADEIYEKLIYEGRHISIASFGREIAERTVTVSGCSKTYSMTGWRIGYAAAPHQVAQAMANLQDQMTSNATSFAQKGALEALRLPAQKVAAMRNEFQMRRDVILSLLREELQMDAPVPQGAFYVFIDVRPYLGAAMRTDAELATHLLETAGVATIPGSAFYGPGHLRLSYAASRADIERGVCRIAQALHSVAR
jgi:aspartate aminotransferase